MSKTGRNDPCNCGSGKKFKKCCLLRNISIDLGIKRNVMDDSKENLVKTLTDEFFQPVRLYYTVHNKKSLESCFQNLNCMDYDENLNDWIIHYTNEAAKYRLKISPKNVPKEAQPLVIATIYIEHESVMLVDVRSIERAKWAIEFIDKNVPKNIAQVTDAAIYNKLITAFKHDQSIIKNLDYDEIFSQKNITVIDPEKTIEEAKNIADKYEDKDEKLQAWVNYTENNAKKPLPLSEKFPIHFYEEGIKTFETCCQMRQMIAFQHYLGNRDYSFYDLMQDL